MVKDNEEDVELQQEEYQYSDPDSTETYIEEPEEQPAAPVSRMGDDRRKRIILILVILGLLFVVFQFVKAKSKTTKTAEPVVASQIEKAAQEKSMPGVSTPTVLSAEQPALGMGSAASPTAAELELSAKLAEQIQSLQTSVSNLENSVKNLTEKMDSLKKQERTPKVNTVQKKAKPVSKRHHTRMGIKPAVYYIHAIVPRRAWLQTKNGEAITVQIGDNIPGYGVVKSIDASEGVIATSSNKMIHFNSNDN